MLVDDTLVMLVQLPRPIDRSIMVPSKLPTKDTWWVLLGNATLGVMLVIIGAGRHAVPLKYKFSGHSQSCGGSKAVETFAFTCPHEHAGL